MPSPSLFTRQIRGGYYQMRISQYNKKKKRLQPFHIYPAKKQQHLSQKKNATVLSIMPDAPQRRLVCKPPGGSFNNVSDRGIFIQ